MNRAAAALAVALLALAAPAFAQQNRPDLPTRPMAPADGYDVDALLRRSREMTESYQREERYPLYLEQQQRANIQRELPAAQQRELDARRVYEAERNRVRNEAGGQPRTAGERMLDRDTLQRQQLDAERARRSYDDSIPNLWRR